MVMTVMVGVTIILHRGIYIYGDDCDDRGRIAAGISGSSGGGSGAL